MTGPAFAWCMVLFVPCFRWVPFDSSNSSTEWIYPSIHTYISHKDGCTTHTPSADGGHGAWQEVLVLDRGSGSEFSFGQFFRTAELSQRTSHAPWRCPAQGDRFHAHELELGSKPFALGCVATKWLLLSPNFLVMQWRGQGRSPWLSNFLDSSSWVWIQLLLLGPDLGTITLHCN